MHAGCVCVLRHRRGHWPHPGPKLCQGPGPQVFCKKKGYVEVVALGDRQTADSHPGVIENVPCLQGRVGALISAPWTHDLLPWVRLNHLHGSYRNPGF